MKWIVAVLSVICIAQAYFVYAAKKERDFFYESMMSTYKTNVSTSFYLGKIHLRLAEDIRVNPAEAQNIIDSLICSKGAFPENYINDRKITEDMNANLKSLQTEIAVYCKNRS